jgi:hypothetical protein
MSSGYLSRISHDSTARSSCSSVDARFKRFRKRIPLCKTHRQHSLFCGIASAWPHLRCRSELAKHALHMHSLGQLLRRRQGLLNRLPELISALRGCFQRLFRCAGGQYKTLITNRACHTEAQNFFSRLSDPVTFDEEAKEEFRSLLASR